MMTITVVAVSGFALSVIVGLVAARVFAGIKERRVRAAVVAAALRGLRRRDDQ